MATPLHHSDLGGASLFKPRIAVTVWKRQLPTFWDPHTPLFALHHSYVDALMAAGAVPLLVAHPNPEDTGTILDVVDGLMITGGGDIHPSCYGAANQHSRGMDAAADAAEIALLQGARDRRLPTFGICRGMQILNVTLGGTMHQHITTDGGAHPPEPTDPDEIKHFGHQITMAPDSRLARLFGQTERFVNSFHHQAVDRVAADLRPTAWAPDGVVEALEHTGDWDCFGVQWHPEKTLDSADQIMFDMFVESARSVTAPAT